MCWFLCSGEKQQPFLFKAVFGGDGLGYTHSRYDLDGRLP